MIPKLFSDKFINRARELGITYPELMGLYRSTIRMYPFITNKGFQDVRNVFRCTAEENERLIDYYGDYFDPRKDLLDNAKTIAKAVEQRLTYRRDSDNWGQVEYWARPIEVHNRKYDDCDGYSVLITYLLRLFGAKDYEVFTAAGPVFHPSGRKEYHAYTVVFDTGSFMAWAVEGSFYHDTSMKELGMHDSVIHRNKRYGKPWWITNDKVSYNSWPLPRFVR